MTMIDPGLKVNTGQVAIEGAIPGDAATDTTIPARIVDAFEDLAQALAPGGVDHLEIRVALVQHGMLVALVAFLIGGIR